MELCLWISQFIIFSCNMYGLEENQKNIYTRFSMEN